MPYINMAHKTLTENKIVIYTRLADPVSLACIIFIDLICMIKLQNWYCYAKTIAEKTAMEEASKRGIQLLIVVPSVTIYRMLQPTLNLTLSGVATYMKGTKKTYSTQWAHMSMCRTLPLPIFWCMKI